MEETKITVNKLHSEAMLNDELKSMLCIDEIRLTLGGLMGLVVVHSPYIFGGRIDEESLSKAYEMIEHGKLDAIAFHEELQNALDRAFRVFEIVKSENDPTSKPTKSSEIGSFSPEWFADIMSQACQSMPSLTYSQILHEIPLVTVFHLAMSTARRNGVLTERPNDINAAIAQFKELQKQKRKRANK